MDWITLLRWIHILGAAVLLGTGAGIAFFMMMAQRSGDPRIIAHTSGAVILADWIFTATAVILQPITGFALAFILGWDLTEGWILLSLGLYVLVGCFWLPVVWIQHRLRDLAIESIDRELTSEFRRLYRIWFLCGFPAFVSVLAILWLMVARPVI
ncbi:MAG: DUF2269 domain-containing protein [Kiloniellales bacterium]